MMFYNFGRKNGKNYAMSDPERLIKFIEEHLNVPLLDYQKEFIRRCYKVRRPPITSDDLKFLTTQEIIEDITNEKGWVVKIRRLPGKDWVVEFKKFVKELDYKDAPTYGNVPCADFNNAVREAALKVIVGEKWDYESYYEQRTDSGLVGIFRSQKNKK